MYEAPDDAMRFGKIDHHLNDDESGKIDQD